MPEEQTDTEEQTTAPETEHVPADDIKTAATSEPTSTATAAVTESVPTPKNLRKKWLILPLVIVLLALAGGGYWYFRQHKSIKQNTTSQVTPTPQKVTQQLAQDPVLAKFLAPQTGETWLATPKQLPNQKFYKEDDPQNLPTYYEVGKRGSNTILMSVLIVLGEDIRLYEKAPDGKVVLIAHPDGEAVYNQDADDSTKSFLPSTITFDTTIHYDSLSMPNKLDLDKDYVVTKLPFNGLGYYNETPQTPNAPKLTVVKTLGQSKLIKKETAYADTKLTSINYLLQTPINTLIALGYEPLETSLKGYSWQAGSTVIDDKLEGMTQGCSVGNNYPITRSEAAKDDDFQAVGKSLSGQTVYEAKDSNYVLVQKAYDEFTDFSKDAYATDVPYRGISKADFVKQHAVVFYKDRFGQWLAYVRSQLRPQGGCAKPVIYLYPERSQQVTVRVGANVTVSDPLYNARNGWNVWAQPSGRLTVSGLLYDSLFWEGQGWGSYPAITAGTVVPHDQAAMTIRQQLVQLGLTTKETEDFMAYWQDKLPAKPYIRLTWFNTADMDRLAPLVISPKPDTVIRVFLDFAGLDQPLTLPAQNLASTPRRGFTIVEWGGLAATGLK